MKIPMTPPPFDSTKISPNRFLQIFERIRSPTVDNRYLHWDKLRNLPIPHDIEGLTREEWWWGLKLSRSNSRRMLPLPGIDGKNFYFSLVDPIPQMLHQLDSRAGGVVLAPDEGITPSMRDQYVVRSLTEEAITSSQLEGAATTRDVAKQMLRSGRPPRDAGEKMIFNNYFAMQEIRQIKDQPLTSELILKLHRILANETLDNPEAVGRWRLPDENIQVQNQYGEVLHTPPAAADLPKRMQLLCDFANGKTPAQFVHPVLRAIILHFWLAYDHPFVDGNGRCARALFYWSMLHSGYWLCEFVSISEIVRKAPTKYGKAFLYTETDDNDLTYFILYHLEVVQKAIAALHAYIDRKAKETRAIEDQIKLRVDFNHRQLALLIHALRHLDAIYTIAEHRASHGVAYDTARTDLLELAKIGLFKEFKKGKEYYFRPVPDLERRLENRKG